MESFVTITRKIVTDVAIYNKASITRYEKIRKCYWFSNTVLKACVILSELGNITFALRFTMFSTIGTSNLFAKLLLIAQYCRK